MGKANGSAIGVEIGVSGAKAVHVRQSGGRVVLEGCMEEEGGAFFSGTASERGAALRRLVKGVGGGRKQVGVALSSGTMFLRLFEQPETPVAALREAMRLNGPVLFNQDCRGYLMDCGLVDRAKASGEGVKRRYLAGGILRSEVEAWSEACRMGGMEVGCIQISSVSTLNAFEHACPEAFGGGGFLLLDLGQTGFTIMAGSGGELMLLRVLEGGGRALMEELSAGGAVPESRVFAELEGAGMRDRVRLGVAGLVRQVLASVGFLESRVGGDVTRVHVSGGKWGGITGVLSEELQMECVPWNPLGDGLSSGAPEGLHAACGAALQVLGVPAVAG